MKKKSVRICLIGLLLLAMGQNEAIAQFNNVRVDNLNYWIYGSGACVVQNNREGFAVYPYPDTEYVIPESITVNGKTYKVETVFSSAFYGSPVRRVTLPGTLETIESGAFQNTPLSEINIPMSVKTIRSFAFANSDLTRLEIPASVTLIGENIARDCQKLHNIFVDKGNENYKDFDGVLCTSDGTLMQFPGARTGTYVTPSSVREIGNYGLYGIEHIDTLVLSEGLCNISTYAFKGNSSLSMLVMGSTVTKIQSMPTFKTDGDASFYCFATTPPTASFGYETLKDVTLYVQKGCKEAYQEGPGWNKFKEIKEMEDGMTITKLNIQYDGPAYGDFPMKHTLVQVILKDLVYYILDVSSREAKVERSSNYASDFDSWNAIYREERYDIPACVTVDDKPYRVTEIVDMAFQNSNVRELTLPDGLVRIGRSAFFDSHLEVLDIPATVEEIGGFAFGGKTPVKSITCRATVPPSCEDDIINTHIENVTLYVPEESVDSYRQAPVWSGFKDIRAIVPTGITSVPDNEKKHTESYYDLQGRQVQRPQKGIYIRDGRKVVVK